MVSCEKGPTRHAYAWQIGPFSQNTLDILSSCVTYGVPGGNTLEKIDHDMTGIDCILNFVLVTGNVHGS